MIVAFDANILVYLFDESANAPTCKTTGLPVERCRERVEYLIATLQREKTKIIIPTPSLAESLVQGAGRSTGTSLDHQEKQAFPHLAF
ncbi:hypothetical protein [Sinorhizobium prairiense]|uniref:hypothetical protein n=1 Tax=unclassified Sinorhizobium TaxID=2613772 RepID=UPI0023D84310|nr:MULTISPECIES: hypothetical protein [unclassified Sinorhizobium]WEJ14825.1 hypothetical protein N0Q91_15000 [Sinorhizobium sp. K101]WEJ37579.1 hypothetical protein N0R80_05295 [Sinorhizobium sp. C101]